MKNPELAVVMPVYNEEGAIRNVLLKWTQELERLGIRFEIHVYNDGSKDGSLKMLRELAGQNPRLVVHDKKNSGHGPTILQGYRENSETPWIFQIDSDDEIGCESFQEFWEKRESFDFLIGARVRPNQPLPRKVISSFSRVTVRIFYGKKVHDVNSPFRLMRSEI